MRPALSCLLLLLAAGPLQALEARVRASLDAPPEPWVGQQMGLVIDLLGDGVRFTGQRITLPALPGTVLLETGVNALYLQEVHEGKPVQVLRYHYPLFAQRALRRLHRASGGIPRLVNVLAHKALLLAYGRGLREVSEAEVALAVRDTDGAQAPTRAGWGRMVAWLVVAGAAAAAAVLAWRSTGGAA